MGSIKVNRLKESQIDYYNYINYNNSNRRKTIVWHRANRPKQY